MTEAYVIGHRGDVANHVENSLPAFRSALAVGCEGIELDVHLSADGVPFVFHDAKLGRLTDRDAAIADLDADVLRATELQVSPELLTAAATIPTLDEVLAATDHAERIYVELKAAPAGRGDALCDAVVEACDAHRAVRYLSFDRELLRGVQARQPSAHLGLNIAALDAYLSERDAGFPDVQALSMPLDIVTARMVAECHALGREIYVWGIRDAGAIQSALALRPDVVITDLCSETLRARAALKPR